MCVVSNSVQWSDPYSQKIWQLQPPLSDPLPHPSGVESTHTEAALHDHQNRAGYTHIHAQRQAGRLQGEYESGTLEMLESTVCQLGFSEM